jgi:multicomponent Na+:H+ antiporter subunit G
MRAWLVSALLVFGAGWMLIAALGVLRMPDLFSRMQASAKAGTLGIGVLVLSVAVHFGDLEVSSRAALIIAFFFLTAPVAAHMIARAAYLIGVPLWSGTQRDELRTVLGTAASSGADSGERRKREEGA